MTHGIVVINGAPTLLSDENQELLNETIRHIVNEHISYTTGDDDFDMNSLDKEVEVEVDLILNVKTLHEE